MGERIQKAQEALHHAQQIITHNPGKVDGGLTVWATFVAFLQGVLPVVISIITVGILALRFMLLYREWKQGRKDACDSE